MRITHASQTQDGKRLTYHGASHPRWSTPAAPTFDAVGMPKRNTYRPNVEPIHSSDILIAERLKAERKAVRKADRVYHRSQAKVHPQPVVLRRKDGSTLPTFNHPSAITARIVQQPRQMSKKVDIAHVNASAVYAKPGTLYTLERKAEVAPTDLVVEQTPVVARTRDTSVFLAILDKIAPSKLWHPDHPVMIGKPAHDRARMK